MADIVNIDQAKKTGIGISSLSQNEEWQLLQRLEHSACKLPTVAVRYRRKLAVRRLKRNLGSKLFDIDHQLLQHIRHKADMSSLPRNYTIHPASNQPECIKTKDPEIVVPKLTQVTSTPYTCSFARRLFGSARRSTVTKDEPWLSSWNGRKLRPYLRRDYESCPPRMRLLQDIKRAAGKPRKQPSESEIPIKQDASIDYVYFQREHLAQVNTMLAHCFWEGIDVSESLLFPEFSVVVLYKRCVIGCALMTPEAYVTFIAVLPGWEKAGVGQFMLYHLFQTSINKDITLHVSANNNAMILYQKFGFKPEEFIVNFYDKYLPSDSIYSKNAFLLRLRR